MAKIELQHVNYIYGEGTPFEVRALDDVSLCVREGTVIIAVLAGFVMKPIAKFCKQPIHNWLYGKEKQEKTE